MSDLEASGNVLGSTLRSVFLGSFFVTSFVRKRLHVGIERHSLQNDRPSFP